MMRNTPLAIGTVLSLAIMMGFGLLRDIRTTSPSILEQLGYVQQQQQQQQEQQQQEQEQHEHQDLPPTCKAIRRRLGKNATMATSSVAARAATETAAETAAAERGIALHSIKRLHLIHISKAGGTDLIRFLKEAAKDHHGIQFTTKEAPTAIPKALNDPTVFTVIHIREPLARAISHYKYNHRWSCNSLTSTKSQKSSFTPTLENIQMTFSDFIDLKHEFAGSGFFFECVSAECESRWITGTYPYPGWDLVLEDKHTGKKTIHKPSQSLNATLDLASYQDKLVETAIQTLYRYDLIIVLEWMKDPSYVQQLEDFFGLPGGLGKTPLGMNCGQESAEANRQYPLTITDDEMERLRAQNQADIRMYQQIVSLCPNGPNDLDFGGLHFADLVR